MEFPLKFDFPAVGTLGLAIVSFVNLTNNTIFGNFFRWLPFGLGWFVGFIDFVLNYYEFLASACVTIIAIKWIKNVYGLAIVYLLSFLFFFFLLKSVGVA
jgi:hypothetical protein